MGNSITYTGTLVSVGECTTCGVNWAIPADFMKQRRRDHQTFYCPNGHSQYYPQKSDVEDLKDKLAFARSQRDQARAEAAHNENRRRAEKAAKTKLQRRVAAGVCPCCKRTFQSLASHMKAKHPTYPWAESES